MFSHADVVIVGGGPIGLAHAWGIKKLNPALKVVVIEKYEEYQRKHTLIMQHEQLHALMNATDTLKDPDLVKLLAQLKKDPHIRTSELEQAFKSLAMKFGVEMVLGEVKPDQIQAQLFNHDPRPRLIIGADGTHSVVDRSLFPKNNQVKHEFDYVLQLRYEIEGDKKAEDISAVHFYQEMARLGFIANEYVGRFDGQRTPVTMQMMISKEGFYQLREATSKNPLLPFADEVHDARMIDLPRNIQTFLTTYLRRRLQSTWSKEQSIDHNSIRISVNEAPATHAQQVFTSHDNVATVLVGDAGLGLSYFKGLNAGLQSTARLLSTLKPVIAAGLTQPSELLVSLSQYQTWFLNDFAPRKIAEVEQYSTWRIRAVMTGAKVARGIKGFSVYDPYEDFTPTLRDALHLLPESSFARDRWRMYPHRQYDLVKFGQFSYVPLRHTLSRIGKIFGDYFKPYKSSFQFRQDLKQPLVGIAHVFVGVFKLFGVIKNPRLFADGLLTIIRGGIELATTPLTYLIKPITRGIATFNEPRRTIETNTGMQRISHAGLLYLETLRNKKEISNEEVYRLLAYCNDLHRKFDKGVDRGQLSHIALAERTQFATMRDRRTKEEFQKYFLLFENARPEPSWAKRHPRLTVLLVGLGILVISGLIATAIVMSGGLAAVAGAPAAGVLAAGAKVILGWGSSIAAIGAITGGLAFIAGSFTALGVLLKQRFSKSPARRNYLPFADTAIQGTHAHVRRMSGHSPGSSPTLSPRKSERTDSLEVHRGSGASAASAEEVNARAVSIPTTPLNEARQDHPPHSDGVRRRRSGRQR